jgi:hypothetical protein
VPLYVGAVILSAEMFGVMVSGALLLSAVMLSAA